jgi:hypothetical protein
MHIISKMTETDFPNKLFMCVKFHRCIPIVLDLENLTAFQGRREDV